MTSEELAADVKDAVNTQTTLRITWVKFAAAAVTALGLSFGGGAWGVSTQTQAIVAQMKAMAEAAAAAQKEQAATNAKLADRILVIEGVVQAQVDDHKPTGQYGRPLSSFGQMAAEFSSGKIQHFLLVDEVKRNQASIDSTRGDITKLVESIGELKADVGHLVRTVERGAK